MRESAKYSGRHRVALLIESSRAYGRGLLLGVADRDEDLLAGMRTTLARIKAAAEEEAHATDSTPGTTFMPGRSER